MGEGVTYNPGEPRRATLQNSFSSQAGWEFYQAVRISAQGGRARPADRLPATTEEQAGVTPQVEVQEEVERSRLLQALITWKTMRVASGICRRTGKWSRNGSRMLLSRPTRSVLGPTLSDDQPPYSVRERGAGAQT